MSKVEWPFTFVADPAAYREPGTLVVHVPAKARGKEKLLDVLARGLRFPKYFGWNWDAADECLRDLSWLAGVERVAIVHEGLPFSTRGEFLMPYLQLLADVVRARDADDAKPKLIVVFSERVWTVVVGE